MKVYLHTDIEGIAGWAFYADLANGSVSNWRHTQRMNRLLTREANAAVRACKAAGADEVIINDSHGHGYNINFEELDSVCRIVHGRGGYGPNWLPLLDGSCDVAIGIGMHAMAGTPGGVCAHSYWHLRDGAGHEWALSECTMFAALAGYHGVPLAVVSGDDKLCAEVHEKLPDCETVEVKKGLARENACSLTPDVACERIEAAVARGLANLGAIKPFVLQGAFALNLSNRDPLVKVLDEDVCGDDLWTVMHEVCNRAGAHYSDDSIDDGAWRYPGC